MSPWTNHIPLVCSLLLAVLLALTYSPWPEIDRPMGDASIDWMSNRYQEHFSQHPLMPLEHYPTRKQGENLAVRLYKSDGNSNSNAVLVHGGWVDSTSLHPLALGLQKRGINVYVPDVRGHGGSDPKKTGNLEYMWQNLNDLEDLLKHFDLRQTSTVFVGHSSQGGGAWYLASQKAWQRRFAAFVAVAPMMGAGDELVKEECLSNFALSHTLRFMALMILNAIGITAFNGQPVMRGFKRPANSVDDYSHEYSYSMALSHAPLFALNYRAVLAKIPSGIRVMSVSAGMDEGFPDPNHFLKDVFPSGDYVTLPDATHMGILFDEALAETVAEFVKNTTV